MEAYFLPAPGGQRLAVHHAPATGRPRGVLLFVHAFAEEMNKSRRMVALAARALSASGHAVLQIDLEGCGDSSGELEQARWAGWVDDVLLGVQWLRQRYADAPLWLWGHRAGALLATQAAARLPEPCGLLLWQPPTAGKPLLAQFLRLKAAAEMQQGDGKAALERARADLAAGQAVDVAGYLLPAAVAQGLEQAVLDLPPRPGPVVWLETSTREPAALLPASAARVQAWQDAGHAVTARAVAGPAFWQTQEIEDAPALVEATVQAVQAVLATRNEVAA